MAFDYFPLSDDMIRQGLVPWWNEQQPWMRQMQFTFNQMSGYWFGAVIGLFIVYAGTQFWKVLKHFVKPGLRIGNDDFENITQGEAIRCWFKWRPRKYYQQMLQYQNDLRWQLGVAALVSFLIFSSLGLLLPLALTGFGANAIVASTSSTACAKPSEGGLQFRKAWPAAASYFEACLMAENQDSSACKNTILINARPGIDIAEIPCPFQQEACLRDEKSYSLSYNLSVSMLNLNIPNNVSIQMEHRIMYSPLHLTSFQHEGHEHHDLEFHDSENVKDGLKDFFRRRLWTVNGPNKYTDEFSGGISNSDKFIHLPQMRMDIFPGFPPKTDQDSFLYTHKLLKVKSASTFQLVLFPGLTNYNSTEPIIDPLFRASRPVPALGNSIYTPDHEATGLGLAEQYRFCIMDHEASEKTWGCSKWQSNRWSSSELESSDDNDSAKDEIDPSLGIFSRFESEKFPQSLQTELRNNQAVRRQLHTAFIYSSVEESLRENTQLPLSKTFTAVRLSPVINPYNQTLLELQTIFTIAGLRVYYAMLEGVQNQLPAQDCGAILSINPNFTNFNGFGVLFVVSVFAAIIFWSKLFDGLEIWRKPSFITFRDSLKDIIRDLFRNIWLFIEFIWHSVKKIIGK